MNNRGSFVINSSIGQRPLQQQHVPSEEDFRFGGSARKVKTTFTTFKKKNKRRVSFNSARLYTVRYYYVNFYPSRYCDKDGRKGSSFSSQQRHSTKNERGVRVASRYHYNHVYDINDATNSSASRKQRVHANKQAIRKQLQTNRALTLVMQDVTLASCCSLERHANIRPLICRLAEFYMYHPEFILGVERYCCGTTAVRSSSRSAYRKARILALALEFSLYVEREREAAAAMKTATSDRSTSSTNIPAHTTTTLRPGALRTWGPWRRFRTVQMAGCSSASASSRSGVEQYRLAKSSTTTHKEEYWC